MIYVVTHLQQQLRLLAAFISSLLGLGFWLLRGQVRASFVGMCFIWNTSLGPSSSANQCHEYSVVFIWSNYSDLTRPISPKWWFSKGNPLISGKSRLVKYYSICPDSWVVLGLNKNSCEKTCFFPQYASAVKHLRIPFTQSLDVWVDVFDLPPSHSLF